MTQIHALRNALCALIALAVFSCQALAHHAPFIFFDSERSVEIEGVVTYAKWANPHPKFRIEVESEDGTTVEWDAEANSKSIMRRMGLDESLISPGSEVRVAGWPAVRGENSMFITNILLPGNIEVVFWPGGSPMWSEETLGDHSTWMVSEEDIAAPENDEQGIFRIWSTSLANPLGVLLFDAAEFPLTEAGARSRAEYDLYDDNPLLGNCTRKGMPLIMETPYPMELVDEGDRILFRMEEGDTLRTLYLDESAMPANRAPTNLGHSLASWEGNNLVVETEGVSWPRMENTGVPQSDQASYVEVFQPSADGKRLDYSIAISDPVNLAEPVTLTKHWLWLPEAVIEPYECDESP